MFALPQGKLNVFVIQRKMMSLFIESFIESTFPVIAWNGNLATRPSGTKTTSAIIVKAASEAIGVPRTPLTDSFNQQVLRKARSILDCLY